MSAVLLVAGAVVLLEVEGVVVTGVRVVVGLVGGLEVVGCEGPPGEVLGCPPDDVVG